MIIDRNVQEKREREYLAPYAFLSQNSAGRKWNETECRYRTSFQRDRDRIIHSKAFRRLEYKTQVFAYYEGDHYRTRLTHTLEVAQIARSIAQYIGANEDLTHAIALAHDLGHTPFGHAGEKSLHRLMEDSGGFEHNRQSLRVVDLLETRYPDFPGLNLTFETRAGIIRHTTRYDQAPEEMLSEFMITPQPSLEAQIVNIADEVAYSCHDIEDGLRSGFFNENDLTDLGMWKEVTTLVKEKLKLIDKDTFLYQCIRFLIDMFIRDLVDQTEQLLLKDNVIEPKQIMEAPQATVSFSQHMKELKAQLDVFLYSRFYTHYKIMRMQYKADRLLSDLFTEYVQRPFQLPPGVQRRIEKGEDCLERIVCDYTAGMTDRFALNEHRKLFLPYEY
jgi:dGTPase